MGEGGFQFTVPNGIGEKKGKKSQEQKKAALAFTTISKTSFARKELKECEIEVYRLKGQLWP